MSKTLVTPEIFCRFPNLFKPFTRFEGTKAKFSLQIVVSKKEREFLEKVSHEFDAVIKDKWGDSAHDVLLKGNFHNPLRDSDKDNNSEYPIAENSVYFSAKAEPDRIPGVFNIDRTRIESPLEVYEGCIIRAAFHLYAFDNVKKGVGVSLESVLKVRDNEESDNQVQGNISVFNDFITDEPSVLEKDSVSETEEKSDLNEVFNKW